MRKSKDLLAIGRSFEASLYEAAGFTLAPKSPTTSSVALTDIFTALILKRLGEINPAPMLGRELCYEPVLVEMVYKHDSHGSVVGIDFDKTVELTNRKVDMAVHTLRKVVEEHGADRTGRFDLKPCENVMIGLEVRIVGMLTWTPDTTPAAGGS